MTTATEDLDLPPLDGEGDGDAPIVVDDVAIVDDGGGDPYDDTAGLADDGDETVATREEPPIVGDDETGFVVSGDEATIDAVSESLLGDDDSPGTVGEDFDIDEGGEVLRDAGEEGFDEPEPELRAEDLPRLDEGGDDDLSIEEAADAVASQPDIRWDDKGFERVSAHPIGHVVRVRVHTDLVVTLEDGSVKRSVDGGATFSVADHADEEDEAWVVRGRGRALMRDGVGVLRSIDDGPLTLVESTAGATAFTLLDDASLVVAMDGPERARLVRIGLDGVATVLAEEDVSIEALATDPRTSLVWAGGSFGLVSYRAR
jgi:hypothetical protein